MMTNDTGRAAIRKDLHDKYFALAGLDAIKHAKAADDWIHGEMDMDQAIEMVTARFKPCVDVTLYPGIDHIQIHPDTPTDASTSAPEPTPETPPPSETAGPVDWTPERVATLKQKMEMGKYPDTIAREIDLPMKAVENKVFRLRKAERKSQEQSDIAPQPPVTVLEMPPASVSPAPAPIKTNTNQALIDKHLAEKGVTRAVDFGVDQPAVDELKASMHSVLKANPKSGRPWMVNGAHITTQTLWEYANRERRSRGQKPITRTAEVTKK